MRSVLVFLLAAAFLPLMPSELFRRQPRRSDLDEEERPVGRDDRSSLAAAGPAVDGTAIERPDMRHELFWGVVFVAGLCALVVLWLAVTNPPLALTDLGPTSAPLGAR